MPEGRNEVDTALKEGLEVSRQAAGAHVAKCLLEKVRRPAELAKRGEIHFGDCWDSDPSMYRERARQDVSRNSEVVGAPLQQRELSGGEVYRKSPRSPLLGRKRGPSGSGPRGAAGALRHKDRLNGTGAPFGNRGNW
jgi:hypothetical protein